MPQTSMRRKEHPTPAHDDKTDAPRELSWELVHKPQPAWKVFSKRASLGLYRVSTPDSIWPNTTPCLSYSCSRRSGVFFLSITATPRGEGDSISSRKWKGPAASSSVQIMPPLCAISSRVANIWRCKERAMATKKENKWRISNKLLKIHSRYCTSPAREIRA